MFVRYQLILKAFNPFISRFSLETRLIFVLKQYLNNCYSKHKNIKINTKN